MNKHNGGVGAVLWGFFRHTQPGDGYGRPDGVKYKIARAGLENGHGSIGRRRNLGAGLVGRFIPKKQAENKGGKAQAEGIKSEQPKEYGKDLGHVVLSLEET